MSEPLPDEPVRIADHDLNDLVSTVNRLVTETQRQSETIARLSSEHDGEGAEESTSLADPSAEGTPTEPEGPSSIFILALAGTAYEEELKALGTWVERLLLPVYGREITTGRPWCFEWREHPEAIARLHGLWLAWQQFTDTEAGLAGPATWHRDYLDPTWLQLRAPDGPFGACTTSPARRSHRLLAAPDAEVG
ncbi:MULTISPECIES: DUF4913 domain-containing protein [Streptomyces]|uniref:DUF4913 domain-containing protein n=1 Tax=Streptomyces tsukubensis (strain DSM 42081 / NBRC 108919 / NRRL 18488 / 9993) TaxID=1114943 RepID=I2N6N0_STRT9|nr:MULTISPECIES: DUF4913 domain-containing protein [Streptomyces]AZK96626.1 DUF4913 domain-containing protein [Streptomyces tsukubensis]EIF92677.1 hypothetical protein [Streptomyces tsukubensis NRRL18488]MYS67835.1 DUF4913 domain-containing protein [Streptomyces sp. SID5473]QKM67371.1 DUF4913 domain-containing protein [Streptomyces tsukubensis NRRL18488]TAI42074.1 DUF4913 domain-containing protein [Streptomyces tsukubensis]